MKGADSGANGVPLDPVVSAVLMSGVKPEEFKTEVILPRSGRVARVRRLKVSDMVYAEQLGKDPDKQRIGFSLAMLAPAVLLDGAPAVYEDLVILDLDDFQALVEAVGLKRDSDANPIPAQPSS